MIYLRKSSQECPQLACPWSIPALIRSPICALIPAPVAARWSPTQYSFLPGFNFQNGYTYDAASNRKTLTAPDGSTNTYNYDTLNRLSTLTNSLTGQFGFGYDALSRRTQLTRPNGINTNYTYDSLSRLLSVLHQAGSTTRDGASYGYDFAGNRTSKTKHTEPNATEELHRGEVITEKTPQ